MSVNLYVIVWVTIREGEVHESGSAIDLQSVVRTMCLMMKFERAKGWLKYGVDGYLLVILVFI